ncbi:MAG TPA: peptidylprolyl isomerase [Opitutaceae bacterium]|nr:peptidylprolyl isomerase [Opitutaceae bacterium]
MKKTICAITALTFTPAAVMAGSAALAPDLEPALRIGAFTTSQYLFAKAYNHFVDSSTRRAGKAPDSEETRKWFRLYLAEQVIKADLVRQKQLEQPEVLEVTERMAQYMLTQTNGPLYRALGGADRIAFRRGRRVRILKECLFAAIPENIGRLWTAIAPPLSQRIPPTEDDVAAVGPLILARYSSLGAVRQISALDFVRNFQRRIAREAPRDPQSLEGQIEDLVVTAYDLAEAKRDGMDQTPQFLEDRHNFALDHVFALYERDVLSKQAEISPAELLAYYQTNRQRYASPMEVVGTLFIYANFESARLDLAAARTGGPPGAGTRLLGKIDKFIIRGDSPPTFAGIPYPALAAAPLGRAFGPGPWDGKYAVFRKEAAGELVAPPIEQIRGQVSRDLLRDKIEARELEYLSLHTARIELLTDLARSIGTPVLHSLAPPIRGQRVPEDSLSSSS